MRNRNCACSSFHGRPASKLKFIELISTNDIISSCIWRGIEHIALTCTPKLSKLIEVSHAQRYIRPVNVSSGRVYRTSCLNDYSRDFGSRVAFSSLCHLPSCQIPRPRQGREGEKCQPLNHLRQVPFR